MRRVLMLLVLTAVALPAAVRLYLKDGEFHSVREYKVEGDRVRYYSVERADWEEIPLELVDLKKTEAEAARRVEEQKRDAASIAEEVKAERAEAAERAKVPEEPGVYYIDGEKLRTIPAAESQYVGENKKKSLLKKLSPVPVFAGRGTLEVMGASSANVVREATPEFYIRLSAEERFGIFKLDDHKGNRVVEKVAVVPVSKEILEEQTEIQVFRRQAGDGLYKIWPMKPLEPGEYAVVQYLPAFDGSLHVQVWDFAYKPK